MPQVLEITSLSVKDGPVWTALVISACLVRGFCWGHISLAGSRWEYAGQYQGTRNSYSSAVTPSSDKALQEEHGNLPRAACPLPVLSGWAHSLEICSFSASKPDMWALGDSNSCWLLWKSPHSPVALTAWGSQGSVLAGDVQWVFLGQGHILCHWMTQDTPVPFGKDVSFEDIDFKWKKALWPVKYRMPSVACPVHVFWDLSVSPRQPKITSKDGHIPQVRRAARHAPSSCLLN